MQGRGNWSKESDQVSVGVGEMKVCVMIVRSSINMLLCLLNSMLDQVVSHKKRMISKRTHEIQVTCFSSLDHVFAMASIFARVPSNNTLTSPFH